MAGPCRDLDVRRPAKPLRLAPSSAPGLPGELIYRAGARELLLRWPELTEVIAGSFQKLKDSFGTSAQIVLDRFDDPEAEEEAPILYLVVRTELEADAAREALDRLDEWWLMHEERANGHLQISLEFTANADLNPEVTVDAVGAATVMRLLDESPGPNEGMLRLYSDNDRRQPRGHTPEIAVPDMGGA